MSGGKIFLDSLKFRGRGKTTHVPTQFFSMYLIAPGIQFTESLPVYNVPDRPVCPDKPLSASDFPRFPANAAFRGCFDQDGLRSAIPCLGMRPRHELHETGSQRGKTFPNQRDQRTQYLGWIIRQGETNATFFKQA